MKIIEAGGARMPGLGLGTWRLSGDTATTIVADGIAAGYRHIDTAKGYDNEREVGEGIRRAGIARNELFVTTKVPPESIGAGDLQRSTEASIEALGIGPVDLLLIHWPNAAIPLEDSIEALNDAKRRGLTRHVGVSNFTAAMVDEAAKLSEVPLVCNQVEYHPFLSQDAVLEACRRNGMALVAYSPIARGEALAGDETIGAIAGRHGKTPAQVALRWEMQQDAVAAIPRTSKPERLRENFAVFDFELSADEMATLAGLSKRRKRLVESSYSPNWDRV